MRARLVTIAVAVTTGMLVVPIPRAQGDTTMTFKWTGGKMTVQCPPDAAGNTGIAAPAVGVNKGKQCVYTLSSANAHKAGLANCIGTAVPDVAKKGNKKPPQAGACSITINGQLGPRTVAPNTGPWCFDFKGIAGNGTATVGAKTIMLERVRIQMLGAGHGRLTASAFKPGVQKPGQAGPFSADIIVGVDEHKALGGIPNSSCLNNAKNLKVAGNATAALVGTK